MAFNAGRLSSLRYLAAANSTLGQHAGSSSNYFIGATTAGVLAGAFLLKDEVYADVANDLHPMNMPWRHRSYLKNYDAHSLRRGYEVYRQVCATCHSMKYMTYRRLIGATHSAEQVKALAASFSYDAEPNDEGVVLPRKGILTDTFKAPYANKQEMRAANNGASPPDMSMLQLSRHNTEDYIFSLLLGYKSGEEIPPGIRLKENQYYNPYMHGGVLAMAPPLNDDGVEYEDGTVATKSQQAKDICTFLTWTADPHADQRKQLFWNYMSWCIVICLGRGYYSRFSWSIFNSRKIRYSW
eukprot:gb/GEZN01011456.1/.p1 GENE.gb/GEZN01011456.1/~~gb/GEZN01011456.1/.p1  ORF type:complete len:297 (+),score=33.45 gb/GEZN01011456.1/:3-893(+)